MVNKDKVLALVIVFLLPLTALTGVCAFGSLVLWEAVIPSFMALRFCVASGLLLALVSFFILLAEEKANDE